MKIIISKNAKSSESRKLVWDLADELATAGMKQCSQGNVFDPPYVYLIDGEAKIGRDTEGGAIVCRFNIGRTKDQNARDFNEKLRLEPILNYTEELTCEK
jgi:hypothetical protein